MSDTASPAEEVADTEPVDDSASTRFLLDEIQSKSDEKAKASKKAKKEAYWKNYVSKLQGPLESKIAPKWRSYISEVKSLQMGHFDSAVESRMGSKIDAILRADEFPVDEALINSIILSIEDMGGTLGASLAPIWTQALLDGFAFTIEEDFGGVAVLSVDDALLTEFTISHQAFVLGKAPVDIQRDLRLAARAAISAGETVQQMRRRFTDVFRVRASASRTLAVARTESGTYLNGLRDKIFDRQGVEKREWSTAFDERVRPDHVRLGRSGPKPAGYNFMEFLGKSGIMQRPQDPRAPANQVVNCRCVLIPVIEV